MLNTRCGNERLAHKVLFGKQFEVVELLACAPEKNERHNERCRQDAEQK